MTIDMQPDQDAATTAEGRGRGKLVLVLLLTLLVAAAATWWFLLRGPAEPEEPVPGEVVSLEPIQVNLADGHYLRIGVALQLTEDAEEVDGSKALDTVIDMFSGVDASEITRSERRHEFKEDLEERLHETYHGEVMAVYFTDLVTQ